MQKISLEKFQQIKNQLKQVEKEYEDNYEKYQNDENYDDSAEEQKVVDKYFEIQNRLCKYDLSDIPFEAWQGMTIISDETHQADFSKTRANIDFAMVEYAGNANFRGCKVINLGKIY